MTFAFCLTIVGFMLHNWLISNVYLYLRTSYGPSVRFQEMRCQLQEYVAFKHIPKHIQERILTYYDFCYKDEFFRKTEIDKIMYSDLKHMIAKETTEKLLKRQYLFMLLPANLLHSIAVTMSEAVFLENDVICRNDHNGGQVSALKSHEEVNFKSQFPLAIEIILDRTWHGCGIHKTWRWSGTPTRWQYVWGNWIPASE